MRHIERAGRDGGSVPLVCAHHHYKVHRDTLVYISQHNDCYKKKTKQHVSFFFPERVPAVHRGRINEVSTFLRMNEACAGQGLGQARAHCPAPRALSPVRCALPCKSLQQVKWTPENSGRKAVGKGPLGGRVLREFSGRMVNTAAIASRVHKWKDGSRRAAAGQRGGAGRGEGRPFVWRGGVLGEFISQAM